MPLPRIGLAALYTDAQIAHYRALHLAHRPDVPFIAFLRDSYPYLEGMTEDEVIDLREGDKW